METLTDVLDWYCGVFSSPNRTAEGHATKLAILVGAPFLLIVVCCIALEIVLKILGLTRKGGSIILRLLWRVANVLHLPRWIALIRLRRRYNREVRMIRAMHLHPDEEEALIQRAAARMIEEIEQVVHG